MESTIFVKSKRNLEREVVELVKRCTWDWWSQFEKACFQFDVWNIFMHPLHVDHLKFTTVIKEAGDYIW